MKLSLILTFLGHAVHGQMWWRNQAASLSDKMGGCSNPKSAMTCKTSCNMIETSANGFKSIYQGQDTMAIRYTGWRDDGSLPEVNLTSDYRFILRLEDCHEEVIQAIDERILNIDVLDYKIRYYREAVHQEECGDKTGYHLQFRRFSKGREFSNKDNDAFMVVVSGIINATWGKDLKWNTVRKCFARAKILVDTYNGEKDDYTKCEAYKYCDKEVDWNEDEVTTPPTTTTTTTTTTGTTPSVSTTTTMMTTTMSTSFSCDGTDCTMEFEDGTKFVGFEQGGIVKFLGIPYAEAPLGDLRWKAPVMIDNYGGNTYDLKTQPPSCVDSEDCLFINIQVKKSVIESGEKVPMAVFIHGGGFNSGSNSVGMNGITKDNDMLVVSIGYRLGMFGFLWSPDADSDGYHGNWGLMDQTLGLKWASIWAPYFGGDPSQVTLNGCSAGSESVWWHITLPMSWPYFNGAVTVGVGLNSAWTPELGEKLFDETLALAGCDSLDCLRGKSKEDLDVVKQDATKDVSHPIKLILEPKFGPVVDGVDLKYQLQEAVHMGHIRPNTPISWNYAENDAWSFANGGFRQLQKVPEIEALKQDIKDTQQQSGIGIPSDYFDQWLNQIYPAEHVDQLLNVFGCPNGANGEIMDCHDKFDRFLTASTFACNTRWALNGEGLKQGLLNGTLGPIYPMEFRIYGCDIVNGVPTKACHCSEGAWVQGGKNPNQFDEPLKSVATLVKATYLNFFKTGTFLPDSIKSWQEMGFSEFNVISDTAVFSENVRPEECDALDAANNHLWDKWEF